MVAITPSSIQAEVSRSKPKSNSSSKRSKDKLRHSTSPILTMMLEEECHNSFIKQPDEEPLHIWNTDKVEAHNQRMKKLDKKLNKYNDDIAKLQEMLRQADEKHDLEMSLMEQREQEARQEIVNLDQAAATKTVDQTAASTEVQMDKLTARLQANLHKIGQLRAEGKSLQKELCKKEKQFSAIKFHNNKLEESSNSLLHSHSDLGLDKIFDENNELNDNHEASKDEYENLKVGVKAMQDQYMGEAQQRLELQKTMAEMLYLIQGAGPQRGVSPQVANACTQVGMDCEARATQLMEKVQDEEEWRNLFAADQVVV